MTACSSVSRSRECTGRKPTFSICQRTLHWFKQGDAVTSYDVQVIGLTDLRFCFKLSHCDLKCRLRTILACQFVLGVPVQRPAVRHREAPSCRASLSISPSSFNPKVTRAELSWAEIWVEISEAWGMVGIKSAGVLESESIWVSLLNQFLLSWTPFPLLSFQSIGL